MTGSAQKFFTPLDKVITDKGKTATQLIAELRESLNTCEQIEQKLIKKDQYKSLIEYYRTTLTDIENHKLDPLKLIGTDGLIKIVNDLLIRMEKLRKQEMLDDFKKSAVEPHPALFQEHTNPFAKVKKDDKNNAKVDNQKLITSTVKKPSTSSWCCWCATADDDAGAKRPLLDVVGEKQTDHYGIGAKNGRK